MSEISRTTPGRFRTGHSESATTVDALLLGMRQLLDDKPFSDISVADVLNASGTSRATFYFYFSSKFSVLCALLAQSMDDIFATVQPFLARSEMDSVDEALTRSLTQVTQAWHRHRVVLRATAHYWHFDPNLHGLWLSIAERFVDAGAQEIDREREAGLITSTESSRTLAATLFWGTERILYIAGLGVDPSLPDEAAALGPLIAMWQGTLYR